MLLKKIAVMVLALVFLAGVGGMGSLAQAADAKPDTKKADEVKKGDEDKKPAAKKAVKKAVKKDDKKKKADKKAVKKDDKKKKAVKKDTKKAAAKKDDKKAKTVKKDAKKATKKDTKKAVKKDDKKKAVKKAEPKSLPTKPVNINTATLQELQALNGVGPVRAQAIIDYRKKHGKFKTPEDLMKVEGIAEGIFGTNKKWIKVR